MSHHDIDDGAVHSHIAPVKFYVGIFAALVALTLLTVGLSYIHLGAANLAIAIIVASMKAALVVIFFMHLSHDNKFNSVLMVGSLMFIGVFFAYTMNDTNERQNELNDVQGNHVYLGESETIAPGRMEPRKAVAPAEHGGHSAHGAAAGGHEGGAAAQSDMHGEAKGGKPAEHH